MNPSGAYSQGIPGRCNGRGTGIIDFVKAVPLALDAAALLETLEASACPAADDRAAGRAPLPPPWSRDDASALRRWASDFLAWLQTSANGRSEAAATNNHGSWFDALSVALAGHVGNQTAIDATCGGSPSRWARTARCLSGTRAPSPRPTTPTMPPRC